MEADMLPFLFEKLALPVGMIVPLGALILAFLVGLVCSKWLVCSCSQS